MPKHHSIDTAINWILIATATLLPLFFLPLTTDYYETNKWFLLVGMSLLILLLWAFKSLATRTITLSLSGLSWGFGALSIAALLSLVIASPNKVEAVLMPVGLVTFLALFGIGFLGTPSVTAKGKVMLRWGLLLSAGLLGLIAIYMSFGIGRVMFPDVEFLTNTLWTPSGTTLTTIGILLLSIPFLVAEIWTHHKKNEIKQGFSILLLLVVSIGLIVSLFQIMPQLSSTILPLSSAWAILLENFKLPLAAIFGTGAENYLSSFTAGRPAALNASSLWNARFTTSTNTFFHLATTMGILGLIGTFVWIRSFFRKSDETRIGKTYLICTAIAILAVFIAPPSITLLVFISLLFFTLEKDAPEITWHFPAHLAWITGVVGIVVLLLVGSSGYGLYRVYAAEHAFTRSLDAVRANNGSLAYEEQIKANTLNPYNMRYHIAYSQTNLALANALTSGGATESGQLTDIDRQTISNLIQQAIREAKIATTLAPNNVLAWENLARIYESILGIAQGADQWSIAAYQRAIQLDPTNPVLRLNLAGVYIQLQNYDAALQQLSAAAFLKNNIANIHYNIAYVYRLRKEFLKEALALKDTLTVVPSGSEDASRVLQELEVAKSNLTPQELAILEGQPAPQATDETTTIFDPAAEAQTTIEPRLDLPPEASPATQ